MHGPESASRLFLTLDWPHHERCLNLSCLNPEIWRVTPRAVRLVSPRHDTSQPAQTAYYLGDIESLRGPRVPGSRAKGTLLHHHVRSRTRLEDMAGCFSNKATTLTNSCSSPSTSSSMAFLRRLGDQKADEPARLSPLPFSFLSRIGVSGIDISTASLPVYKHLLK